MVRGREGMLKNKRRGKKKKKDKEITKKLKIQIIKLTTFMKTGDGKETE